MPHLDTINPRPTRFVSGKASECRRQWIRGLGGEKLLAASYALLRNLKKGLFFAIGETSRFFVACFLHSSAQRFLYQTPGRRPSRIAGRYVNTDQRVGRSPYNERARAPFSDLKQSEIPGQEIIKKKTRFVNGSTGAQSTICIF